MSTRDIVPFADVETAGVDDWRQLFEGLHTRFLTGDFATGLRLVGRIGELAEAANHHPDVDLRYPHVNVTLCSHDVFGVTSRDLELARAVSQAAAELGVEADPSANAVVEIALDTWDHHEIKPFWAAVLGMVDHPSHDDELRDLSGSQPTVWFQRSERHGEPRQRFHLDIRVAPEIAGERVAAALAAGGTLVEDDGPACVVLADPQGNKACVTTGRGRA